MESISSVLTHLMSKKGITSAALARKVGVTQPVIFRLMKGETENPHILTLKPLADFFTVSIEQLLGIVPLGNQKIIDDHLAHTINTKLSTIKTISSVLEDLLPDLIEGYQKARLAGLIKEIVSPEILPFLTLNSTNLTKIANQIQRLLISNNTISQD